jgi:serine/threonine protein kinase
MKYLHKNGIIIRNFRPEILHFEDVDSFDVKLIDLSLAIRTRDYIDGIQDV